MKYGKLILEKKEYVFLKRLLNITGYYKDENTKESLKNFRTRLTDALICDNEHMPEDVIRFNSTITLQANDIQSRFQLVSPSERDMSANKVSILAPIGLAVMGHAQGDCVGWKFSSDSKKLKIANVQQAYRPIDIDVLL